MKYKILILITLLVEFITNIGIVSAYKNNFLMTGYVIYIDAGHGGKDNGASFNDVVEDNINLSISSLLVENLVNLGAFVYTSRDGDYDLAGNHKNRKNSDLKRRVELINQIKPNIFISIHLNTYGDKNVKGGQVFHQSNDKSKKLADILQNKLNELSLKSKKSKRGDYYLLNKTNPVGVLIECGFLTNEEDLNNLLDKDYQQLIVDKIIEGIRENMI